MEIEFAALLGAAFEKLIADVQFMSGLSVGERELAVVLDKALARASVSQCPPEIGEKISSNIVFEFGAVLSGCHPSAKFSPLEAGLRLIAIAKEMSPGVESADSLPGFRLSVGGLGHINATPTAEFISNYLARYSADADGFRPTSFVLLSHLLPGRAVPGFREFESGIGLSRSRVLSVAIKKENRDLEELREHIREKPVVSPADVLMFLGLLADSEIQVRPYLEGYQSSQNLPWYFERFLRDSGMVQGVEAKPEQSRESTRKPDSKTGRSTGSVERSDMRHMRQAGPRVNPGVLLSLEEQVLGTRFSYLTAAKLKRPEIIVGHLLGIIRQFYSIYNRPEVRAEILQAEPDAAILRFARLTRVARGQLEFVLSRLKFNPES